MVIGYAGVEPGNRRMVDMVRKSLNRIEEMVRVWYELIRGLQQAKNAEPAA
jgi:hypothetical protein